MADGGLHLQPDIVLGLLQPLIQGGEPAGADRDQHDLAGTDHVHKACGERRSGLTVVDVPEDFAGAVASRQPVVQSPRLARTVFTPVAHKDAGLAHCNPDERAGRRRLCQWGGPNQGSQILYTMVTDSLSSGTGPTKTPASPNE